MNRIIIILLIIFGLIATVSLSKAQGWRGIVPLHSTRKDVEQLIGSPIQPNGITYDLGKERVNVVYSAGDCGMGSEWNVSPGTVIGITVYPQTKLMLSELRPDLNGFEKFINPHNPDSISYNNIKEGLSIGTTSDGEVAVIEYFPTPKDNYLRCPRSSSQQLSLSEMQYYKFDEYSNLSFSDEKARLDNFASYLQRDLEKKGFIVVYAATRSRASSARTRAERAKNYLVNAKGILAERIVTIDGGRRKESRVQLYAVPLAVVSPAFPSQVQIIKDGKMNNNKRRLSHTH